MYLSLSPHTVYLRFVSLFLATLSHGLKTSAVRQQYNHKHFMGCSGGVEAWNVEWQEVGFDDSRNSRSKYPDMKVFLNTSVRYPLSDGRLDWTWSNEPLLHLRRSTDRLSVCLSPSSSNRLKETKVLGCFCSAKEKSWVTQLVKDADDVKVSFTLSNVAVSHLIAQ